MKLEDLQLINRNETALVIFKNLSERERISHETVLEPYKAWLARKGIKVHKEDYIRVFKELEDAGVGELVEHAGVPQAKFRWYFSLKDIAIQVLNPNRKVNIKPIEITPSGLKIGKTRGRPKSIPSIPKQDGLKGDRILVFIPEGGDPIMLKLSDAEKLVKQIELIKSKFS